MTTPPAGGVGSPAAPSVGAAPFAVTAPPELALDPERKGSTTYTITNLTGRPVRARLKARGANGAEDGWLAVLGPTEVPITLGGTITATLTVTVPPTPPAGRHTLHLDVVAEDDTETRVEGQAVSFTVPPPVVVKRRMPWWIFLIIGLAVLALAVSAVLIFTGDPEPPRNVKPPLIQGNPQVGQTLRTDNGIWTGEQVTFGHQWVRCQGDGSLCDAVVEATEPTYVLTGADAGKQIRVHVEARNAGGTETAQSANVGPVEQAEVQVPAFIGQPVTVAQGAAATLGLALRVRVDPARVGPCPQRVIDQRPGPGTSIPVGSTVDVVVTRPPFAFPFCQ